MPSRAAPEPRVPLTPRAPGVADLPGGHLAVLDASPNAIVAVDPSGTIAYANPQAGRTFGYAPGELLGSPVERLLPDRVAEHHASHRASFAANPHARPMGIGMDLWARRKDGREFPVEISLSPLDTPDGPLVFATLVDITGRKAAEAQLLQAQKLESIGRLAGGIAHDFNNMLFAIRGYAEMLQEDLAPEARATFDPDLAARNADAIMEAADRAANLTSQLLAFSRRGAVQPRVLDVNDSIRTIEPMLRRLIGEAVDLRLRLLPDGVRVRIDGGQLDQILMNLVVNARDAMPGGGRITVETGTAVFDEAYAVEHFAVSPGEFVLLAVSDTGVGMDHETRQHVFEPFFTTKELGRGTGLGLATIYGIVQQAGGHIWLYSEPGRGSTFKLYLPRVDGAGTPPSPEDDGRAPGLHPAKTRGTVLLAEDEEQVRAMIVQLLRRAGWTVIETSSGDAALELVESMVQPVDAVISDVVMPGVSGIALAERVLDRFPGIPVVMLSGYTAETLDLERIVARGVRFVSKPLSGRDLLAALGEGARRA
ncbi:MAG TPA: ATP-binding protein [Candidatus Limnocylindrales bacterium]|nr:ATP-binding protein [Candidatus Limnocylindrales bacterium]